MALAVAVVGQNQFAAKMDDYLRCLSAQLPSNLSDRDLEIRTRVYRKAAAQCERERQEAIQAAVRERQPNVSEAQAEALAVDIIDTLDPLSSMQRR